MKMNTAEIIKAFWLPALLFIIPVVTILLIAWSRTNNGLDKETFKIVLGVMLGVMLGFASDIAKRSYDDYMAKQDLRKASYNLLRQDAKRIYHYMWMYNQVISDNKIAKAAKSDIPPALDIRYWSKLKTDNKFLIQAADVPFDQIFKLFGDIEYINDEIALAEKGDQSAKYFANKFYKDAWRLEVPKQLLRHFLTQDEIAQFENELKAIASLKD